MPPPDNVFPPTREAALALVAAVQPEAYARTRNALEGAVSRLSPYITHGLLTLPEVLAGVAARHPLHRGHRFVMELGWREYFRHVWQHRGDGILQSLHPGPLPDGAYAGAIPADLREARTGVPAIDRAVRQLYAQGWLHNHARLWLASYTVHLRKVHWRAGADWMLAHLLDGDLASNHLSWQWVAGTASTKPYLFNAENVARFAPADWHSPGSAIDCSYEALDALARSKAVPPPAHECPGLAEPAPALPPRPATPPPAHARTGVVWLVHPWALRAPPADMAPGVECLGWWPLEAPGVRSWRAARTAFVQAAMRPLVDECVVGSAAELAEALAGAQAVHAWDEPHLADLWPEGVHLHAVPALFGPVTRRCDSFSAWWKRAQPEAGIAL
ncbi:FAD-binding domain-containing protein [uncultured Pseudacidovorax sp.]|uniref:FAD-binding domain-containing protein n=1 Tax=uncultured Pseudacidovorax sp. TaxID=679313 RepID=UPI0025EB14C9|nr:FAD-binding domain-containing protein [uncultured Pseudacidovorax sp.]